MLLDQGSQVEFVLRVVLDLNLGIVRLHVELSSREGIILRIWDKSKDQRLAHDQTSSGEWD